MATRRGTTPTITVTVNGMTFQGYRVYVTLQDSSGTQITKNSSQPSVQKTIIYDEAGNPVGCVVSVNLTQEETMSFVDGLIEIQLTWINSIGDVGKSDIAKTKIDRTLYEEVVSFG